MPSTRFLRQRSGDLVRAKLVDLAVIGDRDVPGSLHGVTLPTRDTEGVPTQILIVDDNTDFLRAARQLLDRDGVAVAAVATNGDEAIGLARDLHPNVVLV